MFGRHQETALPNNWDRPIPGFYRDPLDPEIVKPNPLQTVIYTDGSTEKMVSGAGVCIENEFGLPPRSVGVSLNRPKYNPGC